MRKFLFVPFRSVPFQYVRWFRFGFSQKPKSRCPAGRPLFYFSRPRPNVSRLRRPGAVRAQPCNFALFLHVCSFILSFNYFVKPDPILLVLRLFKRKQNLK